MDYFQHSSLGALTLGLCRSICPPFPLVNPGAEGSWPWSFFCLDLVCLTLYWSLQPNLIH